jgi:long-chain acyl-CoA synthetase
MDVARRVGSDILDGKPVGRMDRLMYALGDLTIYGPLRNAMGLSRIRVAYTAGAAIGPDLFRFFRSIGINLKQLYGQTETCAYVCLQRDGQVKLNTVGQAAPGIELKIADNGEVLVKGVSVLKEYYKRPDATAEVIDENGYFHTGDAGVLDATATCASSTAPRTWASWPTRRHVRAQLHREQAQVLPAHQGSRVLWPRREKVCAFINIDFEAVGNWAERQGLPYAAMWTWPPSPRCCELIADCMARSMPTWPPSPAWPTRRWPLPGAAQGTGPRRRRADPHPQGAPRLHRREIRVLVDALYAAAPSSSSKPR